MYGGEVGMGGNGVSLTSIHGRADIGEGDLSFM